MQTQRQDTSTTSGVPANKATFGDTVVSEERRRVSRKALYFVGLAVVLLAVIAVATF
jgi:hypothetical protein